LYLIAEIPVGEQWKDTKNGETIRSFFVQACCRKTDSEKITHWKKTENPKCTVIPKTTFAKSAVAENTKNTKMPGAKTLVYQGF